MKKVIDKILIPAMTIFVLLISVWLITMALMGGKWYYRWQFEKNNTAETLSWFTREGEYISYSEEDLETIMNQIVDYLMNKEEDMQVVIDGKTVFSNQAIYHMRDVRDLMRRWTVITLACMVLLILCTLYLRKNFEEFRRKMFKQTMITYAVIASILIIVVVFMLVDFDWTFTQFHHILFPSPEKFKDAFFGSVSNYEELPHIRNTLLVEILSIEVFFDAAFMIVAFILLVLIAWSVFVIKYGKNNKKKEESDIIESLN